MPLAISGRQIPETEYSQRAYESKDSARNISIRKRETRTMQQITDPFLRYDFDFPPATVTHEGYGIGINEIERPYSIPIVDVTGGKSLRCSFEFTIAIQNDGFTNPIDNKIRLLQDIGNSGVPVEFYNVHESLSIPKWYIDSISFTHARLNTLGQTTAVSSGFLLINFVPKKKIMFFLPSFSCGKFNPTKKKDNGTNAQKEIDDIKAALAALRATNSNYALQQILKAELRQLQSINER